MVQLNQIVFIEWAQMVSQWQITLEFSQDSAHRASTEKHSLVCALCGWIVPADDFVSVWWIHFETFQF